MKNIKKKICVIFWFKNFSSIKRKKKESLNIDNLPKYRLR